MLPAPTQQAERVVARAGDARSALRPRAAAERARAQMSWSLCSVPLSVSTPRNARGGAGSKGSRGAAAQHRRSSSRSRRGTAPCRLFVSQHSGRRCTCPDGDGHKSARRVGVELPPRMGCSDAPCSGPSRRLHASSLRTDLRSTTAEQLAKLPAAQLDGLRLHRVPVACLPPQQQSSRDAAGRSPHAAPTWQRGAQRAAYPKSSEAAPAPFACAARPQRACAATAHEQAICGLGLQPL